MWLGVSCSTGGYLKASERQQHEISQDYRLDIPNREVRYSYMTTIKDWLEEDVEAGESFHFFQSAALGKGMRPC